MDEFNPLAMKILRSLAKYFAPQSPEDDGQEELLERTAPVVAAIIKAELSPLVVMRVPAWGQSEPEIGTRICTTTGTHWVAVPEGSKFVVAPLHCGTYIGRGRVAVIAE